MNVNRSKLFKGLLELTCTDTNLSHFSNRAKPAANVNLSNESKTTTEYCLETVKKYDYENFMCTLLLKNTARTVALAVRAFNVEVARVAEQVTQPNIGLIRLKFWEDTVECCFSKDFTRVPQHPVANELFKWDVRHPDFKTGPGQSAECPKCRIGILPKVPNFILPTMPKVPNDAKRRRIVRRQGVAAERESAIWTFGTLSSRRLLSKAQIAECTSIRHFGPRTHLRVLNLRKLNKRYFNNLVKSRADNIHNTSFPTMEALEKYSESSVSSIYYLLLEGCNVKSIQADHAASHLGKAQGIIQQLRSVPVARKINFISIPQDVLVKHGVSHEDILRRKSSEGLNECAFEVASRAHQHLVKARSMLKDVPKEARAVLLPAVTVDSYLERLQHVHHDILHPNLQKRAWMWLPKLWFRSFNGEY